MFDSAKHWQTLAFSALFIFVNILALNLTFGGMCSWRRVAVARVFALVVRCGDMMLFVYSRVGKNRDTLRESPAGAGAGRTADNLTDFFSQKVLAVRKANCIYRPVVRSCFVVIWNSLFYKQVVNCGVTL